MTFIRARNAAKPPSSICLIPLWLAALKRRGSLRTRESEKDESDPPQSGGDLRPFVETRCDMSLLGPMGSLSSSFIPCGKAQNSPPFPSRFIVSDRSSPSRVRFAASRPGRLRADPKDALLTRGKGGAGRGARSGESSRMVEESSGSLAHDKGYYHSYCGKSRRSTSRWKPTTRPLRRFRLRLRLRFRRLRYR